jgi:PPOX class probable F420-dependent enzyme
MMVAIPDGYADLLQRPLLAHLATSRPDGTLQVNPMWFDWDGEALRFSHTTKRQKYRNVKSHPQVAVSIADPDNPYRYLEVRGEVDDIQPDPTGAFVMHLANRYDAPFGHQPPPDAPDRVVFVMRPTGYSKQ